MVFAFSELKATRRIEMAKKYNTAHLIHTFNIGDVDIVAISAKDRASKDSPSVDT